MRHQLSNVRRIATGRKVLFPSIGSMTLGQDDVKLTRHLLSSRGDWFDQFASDNFNKEFARWNESKHAYSFMGGRVALSACLAGLNLSAGDEVVLPAYTCVVVPNAIKFSGLKPVYADIELETYGLSLSDVKRVATPRTKAIIVQHLFGLICKEFDSILAWARENGIYVIEDCAHATGAKYKSKRVGNFGDASFYSSEQSKIFNTMQGGVAVTNDDVIADRMQQFYDSAQLPTDEDVERQLNSSLLNYYLFKDRWRWLFSDWHKYRLGKFQVTSTTDEEIQGIKPEHYGQKMPGAIAQLALNQLKKIDAMNTRRRETVDQWHRWCEENGYQAPTVLEDSEPVFLRYPVLVEPERKQNLRWAESLGVKPGVWFVSNVHPANVTIANCPQADKAVQGCIIFPTLLD